MISPKFHYPYTWEERRPHLDEGVLFVPDFYDKHEEFDDSFLPTSYDKIAVEYCSGNGAWLLKKALADPSIFWIGVEKKLVRARQIWKKAQANDAKNLLTVTGEAQPFTRHYLPDNSVDEIYINFPDPWPKEKHARHRLMQAPFVEEMSRIVKPGGTLLFVTDHPAYALQTKDVLLASTSWKPLLPDPYHVTEWPGYGTSFFDALWREKGETIHYIHFVNA